jgi:hypothetical protein
MNTFSFFYCSLYLLTPRPVDGDRL